MLLLTNSRAKDARACLRLHHLKFELGYRGVRESEALRFGTALAARARLQLLRDAFAIYLGAYEDRLV